MSNDLARIGEDALAVIGWTPGDRPGGLWGAMGGWDESEGALPRLLYNTAHIEAAQAGCLYLTSTEENFSSVQAILLSVRQGRVYRPPYNPDIGPEDQPGSFCWSEDATTSGGGSTGWTGLACAGCSMAQWGDGVTDRRPPECTKVITTLLYLVASGEVALLPFRRSSMTAWTAARRMLKTAAVRISVAGTHAGLPSEFAVQFRLAAKKVVSGGRNYYVPELTEFRGAEIETAQQAVQACAEWWQTFADARLVGDIERPTVAPAAQPAPEQSVDEPPHPALDDIPF